MNKAALFNLGEHHINRWCRLNGVEAPVVETREGDPDFGVCAFYRSDRIYIWVDSCAAVGVAGRQWSYPGYVVDRTPYGVLAHELGHHVDAAHGPAGGHRSHQWRPLDPEPLTGYCPNDNEWFAEIFRVFVTNPDLCQLLRPRIFALLRKEFPALAETRPWEEVLGESERHLKAATNKIKKARSRG